MFGGICTLTALFGIFEWQKAFYILKLLLSVHVYVWRSGKV
jgi:hypothetical protein